MKSLIIVKTVFLFLAIIALTGLSKTAIGHEYVKTGPLQKVRVNVIVHYNSMPCMDYNLQIISALDSLNEGTAAVVNNSIIEFMPAMNCRDTTLDIIYAIVCDTSQLTDTVSITILRYNLPTNVIDENVQCYNTMPSNIPFGIREKFRTSNSTGDCIDGFTAPLVGDLNGDGKPEIVMMGITGAFATGADVYVRYINIYNGQTGALMYRHDLGSQHMGNPYHRAPSQIAIADLDNDGIGEIVVAMPDGSGVQNGLVRAFKPVFNGTTITALNTMWTGNINGTNVSYSAGAANPSSQTNWGYPHPYIADLNGDGIPEVIVYNKIFNGVTGRLLMSWQNAAPSSTPKTSSIATGVGGLIDNTYGNSPTRANVVAVRNVAMTGRRPGSGMNADAFLSVPAVVDIDGDGQQEIICGTRIHKFQFNSLTDHTQNTYYTIDAQDSVIIKEGNTMRTLYLSDGFTRVVDIDGDGQLDVLVVTCYNDGSGNVKILIFVYDPANGIVKAASTFYSSGALGSFGIPFIGDINGKRDGWDGAAYTRKLPEVCMIVSSAYINGNNSSTNANSRSGLRFHPLADANLRGGTFNGTTRRHVLGITYDVQGDSLENRLKLSWAMEHSDQSYSTGMTLFDFDNNGTMDICYRDETTLRVISPARGNNGAGKDYVLLNETAATAGTSIMFSTPCFSGTGFEYPTIADVNMDGSANILITHNSNSQSVSAAAGCIRVFEYSGQKWAPCPPVWNQSMYDPTQVRENLQINARPQSMLTPYILNADTIYPLNGSWVQQPIVKENSDYVPVVRLPDAVLRRINVHVVNSSSTQVTLTIANRGTATIGASAPISFYNGGVAGYPLLNSTFIGMQPVGVDIFPSEVVTIIYNLSGNFDNCLIHARIMANNTQFPEIGYDDCDTNNNLLSAKGCAGFSISIVGTDSICVGTTTQLLPNTGGVWVSNNPLVASVTNDGLVTGLSIGEATFTYTSSSTNCFNTSNPVRVDTFPTINAITPVGDSKVVCENDTIQFICTSTGGVWHLSNDNAQIVGSPNSNPVSIKGVTNGKTFISYKIATGQCESTATFLLRTMASPTEIKIGFEKDN